MAVPGEGVEGLRRRLKQLAVTCSSLAGPAVSLDAATSLVRAALGETLDFQTMSDLFDVLSDEVKTESPVSVLLGTAAALDNLPRLGPNVTRQYLESVFLPALASPRSLPSHATHMQVSRAVCEVLVSSGAWPTLQDMVQRSALRLQHMAANSSADSPSRPLPGPALPFHTVCSLVPGLLASCCARMEAQGADRAAGDGARDALQSARRQLLPASLALLEYESVTVRGAVLRALLPALLATARTLGPSETQSAVSQMQDTCVRLLAQAGVARRSALAALVQLSPWITTQSEDSTDMPPVLNHLLPSLAGSDPLDRKRALHLVQQLLPPAVRTRPAWHSWTSLHSLLEEFGVHLIKPVWNQVSALHATDPDHAADETQPAHFSAPRNKLRPRKGKGGQKGANPVTDPVHTEDSGTEGVAPVPMEWICVLWQRAFQHINPRVHRLALRSFFLRWWVHDSPTPAHTAVGSGVPRQYREVSDEFVTGVLLPMLVTEAASRDVTTGFDCKNVAVKWLRGWLSASPCQSQRVCVTAFLSLLCSKGITLSGMEMGAGILAASVSAADKLSTEADTGVWVSKTASQLMQLCSLVANNQPVPARQTQMYQYVLTMMPVITPLPHLDTATAMDILGATGRQAVSINGLLNSLARQYLVPNSDAVTDAAAAQRDACGELLTQLLDVWRRVDTRSGTATVTWQETQALRADVQRVSLLCCVFADQPADPITQMLGDLPSELASLAHRTYVSPAAYMKRLLLLQAIATDAHDMAYQWAADTPLMGALQQACCKAAPYLASYTLQTVPSLLRCTPASLAGSTGQTTTVPRENGQSAHSDAAGEGSSRAPTALQGYPDVLCELTCAQACVDTSAAVIRVLCRAFEVQVSTPVQHKEQLTSAVAVLSDPVCQFVSSAASCPALTCGREGTQATLSQTPVSAQVAASEAQMLLLTSMGVACDAVCVMVRETPGALGSVTAAPMLVSKAEHVVSALRAVLPSQPHAATGDRSDGSLDTSPYVWRCLHSYLALVSTLQQALPFTRSAPAIRFHDTEQDINADRAKQSAVSKQGTPLSVSANVELLRAALSSLETVEKDDLIPVLACVRETWTAVLSALASQHQEGAVSVPPALGELCVDSDHPDSPLHTRLCWKILQSVSASFGGSSKRKTPLVAAVVSTLLLPAMFARHSDTDYTLLYPDLHEPGGPVQWAMTRLITWTATSPRMALLVACQLSSLMLLQPSVISVYAQHIETLLLMPPGGGESGIQLCDESTQVMEGVAGTDLAPRVALLCALYELTRKVTDTDNNSSEACVQESSSTQPVHTAASSKGSTAKTAHTAAGSSTPTEPTESKRPVIMFHSSDDWVDTHTHTSNGSHTAAAAQQTKQEPLPGQPASQSVQNGLAKLGSMSQPATSERTHSAQPDSQSLSTVNGASSSGSTQAALGMTGQPRTAAVDAHSASFTREARAAGFALWDRLLRLALDDPQMASENWRMGGTLHRRKVRLWQALGVLSPFVEGDAVRPTLLRLFAHLHLNEAPSVKQYHEVVVTALLIRQPHLVEEELLPRVCTYDKSSSAVGSFILISAQVAMHAPKAWRARLVSPLLLAISPWLTCHTHNVRTFAQLLTHALLVRYPPEEGLWKHQPGDLTYLRHFMDFCSVNADLVRLRKTLGAPILTWSPVALTSPLRLLSTGACLAGSPEPPATFEGCTVPLIETVHTFLAQQRHRLRDEIHDKMADVEACEQGLGKEAMYHGDKDGAGGDYQRKVMAVEQLAAVHMSGGATGSSALGVCSLWEGLVSSGAVDVLSLASHTEQPTSGKPISDQGANKDTSQEELRPASRSAGKRQELVVVATLIDKIPNLAGLARTCEVFRAAQLVVPDMRLTQDTLFSSISVTAEQWVPMLEVPEAALLPWLEKKQMEGYTLVGLEQTADSVSLPVYEWPERAVLVLGREREGMPAEILQLLDCTVEIPQLGLISMPMRTRKKAEDEIAELGVWSLDQHAAAPPTSLMDRRCNSEDRYKPWPPEFPRKAARAWGPDAAMLGACTTVQPRAASLLTNPASPSKECSTPTASSNDPSHPLLRRWNPVYELEAQASYMTLSDLTQCNDQQQTLYDSSGATTPLQRHEAWLSHLASPTILTPTPRVKQQHWALRVSAQFLAGPLRVAKRLSTSG